MRRILNRLGHRAMPAAALALFLVAAVGHWTSVRSRAERLHQVEQETRSLGAKLRFDASAEEVQKLRARIDEAMDRDVAHLIHLLIDHLDALGASGPSFTTEPAIEREMIRLIPADVSFDAPLSVVFEFLARLYHDDHVIRVERLEIVHAVDRDAPPSVSMRLIAYVMGAGGSS